MNYICGIDEVGRGSLAGPILAAATLFRVEDQISLTVPPVVGLADSKSFSSSAKRERVGNSVLRSPRLVDVGIGQATVEEINRHGIDWANQEAFKRAIRYLRYVPCYIYVDGTNPVAGFPRNRQIVEPKADSKYWTVSAASILAKISRDQLMVELHAEYPFYAWDKNAGYGSKEHQDGLRARGASPHHRLQFIRKIMGQLREQSV